MKAIIVDDNKNFREGFRYFLEVEKKIEVMSEAKTGKEAYELDNLKQADIIFMDIEMPNMNGFELTRKVRKSAQLSHLPVMAVTSLSGEEDRRRGMEAGINDYQPKLDRDLVLESVARLLGVSGLKKAA